MNPLSWIEGIWLSVAVVWGISALRLKPVAKTQTAASRLGEIVPLVLAAFLLFEARPRQSFLNDLVIAHTTAAQWTGVLLAMAGASIAILARTFLGANWSGRVTIKQGHELIRKGPYNVVRHPIYSGLLLAAVGTAVAFGAIRHLLAIPLVFLGFWIKLRVEEQLLTQEFGEQYAAYRREVKGAIIPYIL